MRARRPDTRRWYAAAVVAAAPWWLLPVPLPVYLLGVACALALAAWWSPAVRLRHRVGGALAALGLACLIWLAIVAVVAHRYGDAEWREETVRPRPR
jgi:hypothetical protein